MFHPLPRVTPVLLLSLASVLAGNAEYFPQKFVAPSSRTPAPLQSSDSAANSVPVLVSDFELFASAVAPPSKSPAGQAKRPAATSSGTKDTPPPVLEDTDSPSVQARQLMDLFSITLVQSLQKGGYKAARQPSSSAGGTPGSGNGVLLRGVFAEPDALNRIRRAMLGGGAPGGKFLLYVGTFNMSRPDQPLYQLAPLQSPDSRYGPVITPNSYIPLVKYEIPKNPTADDVRKVCEDIVRNLTVLLNANPSAFVQ
jgi:Domain of unknown function (DUF4410)